MMQKLTIEEMKPIKEAVRVLQNNCVSKQGNCSICIFRIITPDETPDCFLMFNYPDDWLGEDNNPNRKLKIGFYKTDPEEDAE